MEGFRLTQALERYSGWISEALDLWHRDDPRKPEEWWIGVYAFEPGKIGQYMGIDVYGVPELYPDQASFHFPGHTIATRKEIRCEHCDSPEVRCRRPERRMDHRVQMTAFCTRCRKETLYESHGFRHLGEAYERNQHDVNQRHSRGQW